MTGMAAQAGLDDATTVRAAQAGDERAFEALYRRYSRVVHCILLSRLPANEVEDLVQEVFLTALNKLKSLREPAAFPGWIAQIARNRATDHLREMRPEDEIDESVVDQQASAADRAEARRALDAVRELPEAYRETIMMRLVEGLTGPEIAEKTGLSHGSVRVNLHRGMQMLREALQKEAR
jgi:RNA polymerase sigma-70 factor (ECF subfamily)